MKTLAILTAALGLAIPAGAQVQVIADTMGKGKVAGFVTTNAIAVKDFTTLSFSGAQAWYGLARRADVFAGASETVALGQKQTTLGFGGNVNLLKSRMFSLSTFQAFTVPLNRRADASGALWLTSLVASKDLKKLIPYVGYAVTIPLGQCKDKLFTPPEPAHNIPVGLAIPAGKLLIFVEYNFGKKQQIAGVGIAYTF